MYPSIQQDANDAVISQWKFSRGHISPLEMTMHTLGLPSFT